MPPECLKSVEHHKSVNHLGKYNSMMKVSMKIESPTTSQCRNKKPHHENDHEGPQVMRDIRGKLIKIGKIDREELNRLQEKKKVKKTELSSNRKKTKRGLGTTKSSANMTYYGKMATSTTKFPIKKVYGNTSLKKFDSCMPRKDEKQIQTHQDCQRMDKNYKKLNRVNICKLQ